MLAPFPRMMNGGRLARIARRGADATSQTTLRLTILLLLGLLVLAGEFGLDVVLGAFLAGAVLRRWAPGDVHSLEGKLDAIGYGFFIPVFFVTAGMGSTWTPSRVARPAGGLPRPAAGGTRAAGAAGLPPGVPARSASS